MQVATVGEDAVGREIVGLEGQVPPGAAMRGTVQGTWAWWGLPTTLPQPVPNPGAAPYLEIISGLRSVSCLEMLVLKALPLLTQ